MQAKYTGRAKSAYGSDSKDARHSARAFPISKKDRIGVVSDKEPKYYSQNSSINISHLSWITLCISVCSPSSKYIMAMPYS